MHVIHQREHSMKVIPLNIPNIRSAIIHDSDFTPVHVFGAPREIPTIMFTRHIHKSKRSKENPRETEVSTGVGMNY
ncbi:MAG: hypothetical protein G01um1014106_453 [Parcubacteria group bacterium Gr01-1014_106]|nr:MAG: hypothetical protein G01um1014106_453 [Parcubacteria group bacterium Gr01-1014_106]